MRAAIIVAICVLVFLSGAFAIHRYADSKAQHSRDLSKMMSVRNVAESALSTHYKQQGSYPSSLNELPLQTLQWGDEGSSDRDLDSWIYHSDGENFTMTWESKRNIKLFLGGKKGKVSYQENEVQPDKLK
jgi:hypothetical protein